MSTGPQLRGDEGDLFERYHERLQRSTQFAVNTTPENVDDACAHAWMILIRRQPDRGSIYAWLKVVARNEAIRLDQRQRQRLRDGLRPLTDDIADQAVDRRDPIGAKEILLETRELLAPLRERERAAMLLRGLGWTYKEAGERLGVSARRLNQLLTRADARLREHEYQDRLAAPDAHPRARLLAELQQGPPPFLRNAIGRPPSASAKDAGFERRLAWSRAALAIIDHRVRHGITDPAHALGPPEIALGYEGHEVLEQTITRYNETRHRARDNGRGLER